MILKKILLSLVCFSIYTNIFSQIKQDTLLKNDTPIHVISNPDSSLRIKNLNPYFSLHVDSSLRYHLEINKDLNKYYWFLKNSPVGLKN